MAFNINFNEEKNQLLKATRQICFDDIIIALKHKNLLANISHPSHERPHQRIFVVEINNYAYVVPCIINKKKQEIYVKTVYPSGTFTNKYLRQEKK